jgi:anti-anti-sigma factor
MAFEVEVSHTQGRVPVTILHPHGELDAASYQDLIAAAQEACAEGAQDILLDLSGVPYMSSSGVVALQSIAALVRGEEVPDPEAGWGAFRAVHRDRESGLQPHLKLLNPQPRVDRVLETVGFKRYLEVFDDLETAIASF